MPDTLTVTVNGQEMNVPNTIETLQGFCEATGYENREYDVYRIDGGKEVELTGEMFVFDSGDEFVIVPKYVGDA